MGWLFVPGLADWNSDFDSPSETPTVVWVTLSGKPSQRPASWRGWKKRSWIQLLSGTTSRPSMADRGAAEWISSLGGTPASRSALLEDVAALMTRGTCGLISDASSERSSPPGASLRTSRDTYLWALKRSTTTLKSWATELRLACSERKRLAPRIGESGSSSWPTATAGDAKASGAAGYSTESGRHTGMTLTDATIRLWPTPTSNDDNKTPEAHLRMKKRMGERDGTNANRTAITSLQVLVKQWATPRAEERNQYNSRDKYVALSRQICGHQAPRVTGGTGMVLNPPFVEALMGLPIGWTDCEHSATPSYPQWLRAHSRLWPVNS